MGILQTIEADLQANSGSVVLSKEEAELVLKMVSTLKDTKLVMSSLANQASDASSVLPEMNDTWNEGGEAYEVSGRIKEICREVEGRPSLKP